MAVIAPNEWFMTDRDALIMFRNMIENYNSVSQNYEVENPFISMLLGIPKTAKAKVRFTENLVGVLREVATMYSTFDIDTLIVINTRGETQTAGACGHVVLELLGENRS